jgi:hypothetical protein
MQVGRGAAQRRGVAPPRLEQVQGEALGALAPDANSAMSFWTAFGYCTP